MMNATSVDELHSATPAIEVADVCFQYPKRRTKRKHRHSKETIHRHALDQVTFQIAHGETVALLGPNGSGKSTLLKIIATLLKPDAGKILLHGDDVPAIARTKLGVVFQRPGLDALMTVRENLIDSARLYGVNSSALRDVVDRALQQSDLADRQHDLVKTLSGGLARRADLCRALLHTPPIVLLDEPTTGLDPTARQSFLDLIDRQHHASNLTVLMTTHLTDEADRFDRVIFMHEGRVVADDTPANLRRAVGSMRLFIPDPSWTPPQDNSLSWQQRANGWSLTMADAEGDGSGVASQLMRDNIPFTAGPPTLADAFAQLTGATLEADAEPSP